MADTLEEFRRKNQAQTVRAKAGLQALGRAFVYWATDGIIRATPGFGGADFEGQYEKTRYQPTGRLRGGYNWTRQPIGTTSKGYNAKRDEDGPFSAYGVETLARVKTQVVGQVIAALSYIENDVAYGHDIVHGNHNHSHIGPRDFPATARNGQEAYAQKAQQTWRDFL